ncbi:MAG: ComEC/Rec2 family competence protein [Chloroflexota bacterium]
MRLPPTGALIIPAALVGLAAGILLVDGQPGIASAAPLVLVVGPVAGVAVLVIGGRIAPAGAVLVLAASIGIGMVRGEATRLPDGPGSVTAAIGAGELAIAATVMDEPRPRQDRLQVVLAEVVADSVPLRGRLLAWLPRAAPLVPGDRVLIRSALELPPLLEDFDYRAYLARQGIAAVARSFEVEVIGHAGAGPADWLAGARHGLAGGLEDLVPEPEAALGVGILLGIRSGIDPGLEEAFARAGLTHVVAISGWNIAIVTALAAAALRPLRRRPGGRWTEATATVVLVVGYVVLVGGSPSVVRAALMSSALLVARLGGTRSHAAGALALAALVMLLVAPPLLWDVGFQLSALATGGLLAFAGPIDRRLSRLPPLVREPVALTVAAQIATLPVVLGSFERLSLVAPLANVAVVPLVPLVMATSALAAPVGLVLAPLDGPLVDIGGWLAAGLCWLPLRALVAVGSMAGSVPLAAVPVEPPGWLPFAWYPVVAVVALRAPRTAEVDPLSLGLAPLGRGSPAPGDERGRLRAPSPLVLAGAAVGLLVVLTVATGPDGRLHVAALDIGQGDAILVTAPSGAVALIDGGPDPERTLRELGEALPFHRRRIDLLVLTHPHQDHVAGLVDVLDRYRVGTILDPGRPFDNASYDRFRTDAAAEPGATVAVARAGMVIALDASTTLRVLFPDAADAAAALPEDDINNASVVLLLESRGVRMLLTGDAELPVEHLMIARGVLGPVAVLKVGHHGSTSSTSTELLDAIQPALALISCGIDNDYGHPAPETLDHLAARGIGVLRTDIDGTVEVASDGLVLEARAGGRIVARLPLASRAMPERWVTARIGAWQSPISTAPRRSSPRTAFPTASWSTRAACRGSRRRRRASWLPRGSRSTRTSSRSPPCSTTSTSWSRGAPVRPTASWARAGSPRLATPSWRCRSPRIPSAACWTTSVTREAGRACSSRSPTATSPTAS